MSSALQRGNQMDQDLGLIHMTLIVPCHCGKSLKSMTSGMPNYSSKLSGQHTRIVYIRCTQNITVYTQLYASKDHRRNPPVLNSGCQLMQDILYNDHKTVVELVLQYISEASVQYVHNSSSRNECGKGTPLSYTVKQTSV